LKVALLAGFPAGLIPVDFVCESLYMNASLCFHTSEQLFFNFMSPIRATTYYVTLLLNSVPDHDHNQQLYLTVLTESKAMNSLMKPDQTDNVGTTNTPH